MTSKTIGNHTKFFGDEISLIKKNGATNLITF
jgi:hypothetical protein